MQRLVAINMLLRLVDQTPITTLTDTTPDIENIITLLDEALDDVNDEGWWFNTDYNVTHHIDHNGFINIATNLRRIKFADGLVQRGSRVYDSINNTYIFVESKQVISQVTLLTWDDTHPNAQRAAAYKAASDFAEAETLSVDQVKSAQRGYARAIIDLRKENIAAAQPNMLDSVAVQRVRASRRGLTRSRFFGDPDH